jgi:hypothetical protein
VARDGGDIHSKEPTVLRTILIYGLVGGIIVAAPMAATMRTTTAGSIPENAALYGYLSMLLAFTMVFVGIKHYRDKALGGVIRFLPALGVGLGISAVASLFWVVGWELTLAAGFDFGSAYLDSVVAAGQARGAPAAELETIRAEAAEFLSMYANPLFRLPITFIEMFPVGVLISLLSAGLLRNSGFLPARGRVG